MAHLPGIVVGTHATVCCPLFWQPYDSAGAGEAQILGWTLPVGQYSGGITSG